jgi:effector-binding domain-containing protein
LFIKSNDYLVRFKIKASPGVVLKEVEEWSLLNQKMDSFNFNISNKVPFENLDELIEVKGKKLKLKWNFKPINDSMTFVKIDFKEDGNSVYNRITAPFIDTKFKKTAVNLIKNFKDGIELKLNREFKLGVISIDTIPQLNFAYIAFEDVNMSDKALKMIDSNEKFFKFLNDNKIKDGDFPFLIVDDWNLIENTINFKYCFPVKQIDSLPNHETIKYAKIDYRLALKIIYNGNYRISDKAWFTIYDYAKKNGISIENQPVEFYFNDPHEGGNELEWKTEVYMPIK